MGERKKKFPFPFPQKSMSSRGVKVRADGTESRSQAYSFATGTSHWPELAVLGLRLVAFTFSAILHASSATPRLGKHKISLVEENKIGAFVEGEQEGNLKC